MSQQQLERIQSWTAGLQAMATEMAELQAELFESSDARRSTIDSVGAASGLLGDARTLLNGISVALGGSMPASSDSETWTAAIRNSISRGYGEPSEPTA